jgi:hypothetical protein
MNDVDIIHEVSKKLIALVHRRPNEILALSREIERPPISISSPSINVTRYIMSSRFTGKLGSSATFNYWINHGERTINYNFSIAIYLQREVGSSVIKPYLKLWSLWSFCLGEPIMLDIQFPRFKHDLNRTSSYLANLIELYFMERYSSGDNLKYEFNYEEALKLAETFGMDKVFSLNPDSRLHLEQGRNLMITENSESTNFKLSRATIISQNNSVVSWHLYIRCYKPFSCEQVVTTYQLIRETKCLLNNNEPKIDYDTGEVTLTSDNMISELNSALLKEQLNMSDESNTFFVEALRDKEFSKTTEEYLNFLYSIE